MASASEGDYQSVVVILDASRDDSLKAIGGVLEDFSLKSGDDLTLIAVLHQVNSPSTFPFSGALKRYCKN
ncbi:hypothetical protein PanWU01x14_021070 [Parasponia andersonii]|uniref:Uncharacterized protein n=1 Tax=Parasponia andersonii TaxID=3476 RepID=A0A2P5DXV4_PARAD|nr:hypothetical protein PanWU01x14_021070 [Parasponia andersonii]